MNFGHNHRYEGLFWRACDNHIPSRKKLQQLIIANKFSVHLPVHRFGTQTPLSAAISEWNLPVVKLLLEFGAHPDAENGRPLSQSTSGSDLELVRVLLDKGADPNLPSLGLLATAAETRKVDTDFDCEIYALLLEHAADPKLENESILHHDCYKSKCHVESHLQKLMLIAPEYVENIVELVLGMKMSEFRNLNIVDEDEYKAEITRMKSLKISQATSSEPAKTLFDFMVLDANKATRYSKNKEILKIYKSHGEDFRKFVPHYGFALNQKLRKATLRRRRFDAALKLICSVLGAGVPDDFDEKVFGYFSNRSLEKLDMDPPIRWW